jgi:hypothetical protein
LLAWFCPGVLPWSSKWEARYLASHPTWDVIYHNTGSRSWLNFDDAGAREHCYAIIQELMAMYPDLDGIALDYIRYDLENKPTDPQYFPHYFTSAAVTLTVKNICDLAHAARPAMKVGAAVLAGWEADNQALQKWRSEWMDAQNNVLDFYMPMAYLGHDANHTWEYTTNKCLEAWNAALFPDKIFPILSFKDYALGTMKPLSLFSAQLEYIWAHGYGRDNLAFFDKANITAEFKTYLASLFPEPTSGYVVVVNLLPQDTTEAEWVSVAKAVYTRRQTILLSADDAKRLVLSGKPGSKVVVWNKERWPDDIVAWLSPCVVECREFGAG